MLPTENEKTLLNPVSYELRGNITASVIETLLIQLNAGEITNQEFLIQTRALNSAMAELRDEQSEPTPPLTSE